MKRSSSSLQHFVVTTTTGSTSTSMNFTSRHHGGGRTQWQRDSSYQTNILRGLVQDVDHRFQEGSGGHSPNQTVSQPHTFNARRPFNPRQLSPDNQGQFFHPRSVEAHSFQYPPPSLYHPQQDYNQHRRSYCRTSSVQGQQHYQPRQQNPDQLFFHPPQYQRSSSAGQAQQRGSRPPRDLVYRNWEFARTAVPSDCKRFVVLSYNLLADYLAINHRSKLYFHIPHYMLEWKWRKKSIIFELGLWSADIMCLQEVDRFQELEDELKLRGYCGIWKMRTGEPVDGCAIFWRTSRFKLLHEESIEFIELGMRDNVAQFCVLGFIDEDKTEDIAHSPPKSSTFADKIVLCNIHVLYNPKRGDIKLGQIRVLLEKAYTISKAWNNAPVVLCGDFNCTPKSPLYSFISEQQLSLSGLDRDKVSGQASAEIYASSPNYRNNRNEPYNSSTEALLKIDISNESRSTSASQQSVSTIKISNQTKQVESLTYERDESCINIQDASEDRGDQTESDMGIGGSRTSLVPKPEDACPDLSATRTENGLSGCSSCNNKSLDDSLNSEDSPSKVFGSKKLPNSNDDTTMDSSDPESIGSIDFSSFVIKNSYREKEFNFDESMDKKMKDLPLNVLAEFNTEGGVTGSASEFEDDSTFVAALHNLEDPNLQLSGRILDEASAEQVEERQVYDPCLWTPEAIAIATGRQGCLDLEHKLKLKSTYTEVEDVYGTRDANGEPLVTSYHRRFMGTVDYIWRSEGLQTVRALSPIPKAAMQWTPGFPTKKWGSDHIALVTELAFVRGESDQEAESR